MKKFNYKEYIQDNWLLKEAKGQPATTADTKTRLHESEGEEGFDHHDPKFFKYLCDLPAQEAIDLLWNKVYEDVDIEAFNEDFLEWWGVDNINLGREILENAVEAFEGGKHSDWFWSPNKPGASEFNFNAYLGQLFSDKAKWPDPNNLQSAKEDCLVTYTDYPINDCEVDLYFNDNYLPFIYETDAKHFEGERDEDLKRVKSWNVNVDEIAQDLESYGDGEILDYEAFSEFLNSCKSYDDYQNRFADEFENFTYRSDENF